MFTVVEPAEKCVRSAFTMEVATETRARLADMIARVTKPAEAVVDKAAVAAAVKALKQEGKDLFSGALDFVLATYERNLRLYGLSGHEYVLNHKNILILGGALARVAHGLSVDRYDGIVRLSGAVDAARRWMFTNDVVISTQAQERVLMGMLWASYGTNGYEDTLLGCFSDRINNPCGLLGKLYRKMTGEAGSLSERYSDNPRTAGTGYGNVLLGHAYTQDDVAMFSGFTSYRNILRMQWTDARAASIIKALTNSDDIAREAADSLRTVHKHTYTIYPNDLSFGEVYSEFRGSLDSCMSGGAGNWEYLPFDLHPTDAYSAAHFGAGDNGLALIVAVDDRDTVVGRGIMNTHSLKIVRWYGSHTARVQLENTGLIDVDSGCLEGSWLAHIEDTAGKALCPYVDGDVDYGSVSDDGWRILIGDSSNGSADIQITGGYTVTCERATCRITGEEYPVSRMIHQEASDTYIHKQFENGAGSGTYSCFVTGDYFGSWDIHLELIDGEDERVWDYIDMTARGFTNTRNSSIGWTAAPEQYLREDGNYWTDEQWEGIEQQLATRPSMEVTADDTDPNSFAA